MSPVGGETIAQRVAELGLDPRGHRVAAGLREYEAEGEDEFVLPDRWIPWAADASELTGDPQDEGQSVLDHLVDLAGAQGMGLLEYLDDDNEPEGAGW